MKTLTAIRLAAGILGIWLAGSANAQAETKLRPVVDSWWKSVEQKDGAQAQILKSRTAFFATPQGQLPGGYVGTQAASLVLAGLPSGGGSALDTIRTGLVPQGKPVDGLAAKLAEILRQQDSVKIVGQSTFDTLTAGADGDKRSQLDAAITNINRIQSNIAELLTAISAPGDDLGAAFTAGKLDFITSGAGGAASVDSNLLKIVLYAADKALFSDVLDRTNMRSLDVSARELSNLNDTVAFGAAEPSETDGLTETIGPVPALMLAVANKLVAEHKAAFEFTGQKGDGNAYNYKDLKAAGFKPDNQVNRLAAYLEFDQALLSLHLRALSALATIERTQSLALALRYIGGDRTIVVPEGLGNKFKIPELEAEQLSKSGSTEDAEAAAKMRQQMFIDASARLDKTFQRRAAALQRLIFSPRGETYGKLLSLMMESDDKALPVADWNLLRGTGTFAAVDKDGKPKDDQSFHAQPASGDDLAVTYRLGDGKATKSVKDLVGNGDIYWDGHYLKVPAISWSGTTAQGFATDDPKMQKVTELCRAGQDGRRKLTLTAGLLYCADGSFDYTGVYDGSLSQARQHIHVKLMANDGWGEQRKRKNIPPTAPYTLLDEGRYVYLADGTRLSSGGEVGTETTSVEVWGFGRCDGWPTECLANFRTITIDLHAVRNRMSANGHAFIPLSSAGYGTAFMVMSPGTSDSYFGLGVHKADFYFKSTKRHALENNRGFYIWFESAISDAPFGYSTHSRDQNGDWIRNFLIGFFNDDFRGASTKW
jgi:hypothetical protein